MFRLRHHLGRFDLVRLFAEKLRHWWRGGAYGRRRRSAFAVGLPGAAAATAATVVLASENTSSEIILLFSFEGRTTIPTPFINPPIYKSRLVSGDAIVYSRGGFLAAPEIPVAGKYTAVAAGG